MQGKPKVSVITPCYNGELFLEGYFDSILAQTYPAIELIFINDGSTDGTERVFRTYEGRLRARGVEVVYIAQENQGQAAALNKGLAVFSGEYVTWPDADDLMEPTNFEKKVAALEAAPQAGFVCCAVREVDVASGKVLRVNEISAQARCNLFDALIRECGAFCSDIAYMARSDALVDAIGGRCIYESPSGQNWQLLMPLSYKYRCVFIDEPLATYMVRQDSHSHSYATPEARLRRTYELQDILENVLPSIDMTEADRLLYEEYVAEKYTEQRFDLACVMADGELIRRQKNKLDVRDGMSFRRNAKALLGMSGLYKGTLRVKAMLKRIGVVRKIWEAIKRA